MIQMIAVRQLLGDWGDTPPQGSFLVDEETALALEAEGKAYRYRELKVKAPHSNKMLRAIGNK